MSRKTVSLSTSVHQQLSSYALAARAAGVSLLAFGRPAEARIVYTPVHLDCSKLCTIALTDDAKPDFQLSSFGTQSVFTSCGTSIGLTVSGVNSHNAVMGRNQWPYFAVALRAGDRISNPQLRRGNMASKFYNWCTRNTTRFAGPWADGGKGVGNRYLGLKFYFNGKAHYGWARLRVHAVKGKAEFTALLTGYAYETIPNKPIIAGKTHSTDKATLGQLARGASE